MREKFITNARQGTIFCNNNNKKLSAHSFKILADSQAPDWSMFGKDSTTRPSSVPFAK